MPLDGRWRGSATIAVPALILLSCGVLLTLTALEAFHGRDTTVDDAFIVFRYAENLIAGSGFRWNHGWTPAEGFSSTAAVIGIAGLMRTGLDPVVAALVLNLAGAAALTAGLLAASGLRTWAAPVTCLPILYVVADPNFVVHARRGLETAFFVAAAVLVILLAGHVVRASNRRTAGFVRLAVASLFLGLCRPEAPLVVGACWLVAAIVLWRRDERLRDMVPGIGILVLGAAAYVAWRVWYFGTPFPTPYYVKANLPTWLGVREATAFMGEYAVLLIPAALVSLGCWAFFLRRPRAAASPPLEALVVLVIGVPWLLYSARILHETGYNHRLTYPLVGIAALGVVAGVRFLMETFCPRPGRALQTGAAMLLLAGCVAAAPHVLAARNQLRQPPPVDEYTLTFGRIGRAIGDLGHKDNVTLVTPIAGAMPYFSRSRHIDPFGLASDELSRRRPRAERQRFLEELRWDVMTAVVPPATPGATSAADDPWFHAEYFTDWVVPAGDWVALLDVMPDPTVGWLEYHHAEMRKLRDTATLVGRIPFPAALNPPRAWRHFVYVNRASPHHDALVLALRGVVVDMSGETHR